MKKTPKSAPKKGNPPPSLDETVDGGLPELPTLSDTFPKEILLFRDREAEAFQICDLNELAQIIRKYSQSTVDRVEQALSIAGLAILDAWTCGAALNEAKKKRQHGDFESWFRQEFSTNSSGDFPFSLRTAQRYMKLARSFRSAEELITSSPSLRQAYQACGILPPLPESEKSTGTERETVAKAGLVRSVTGVEAKLRRFSEKKISLDDGTRKELLAAKSEIDRLFAALIG